MDLILIGMQVLVLLGIGSIFLFRKYLFSYSSEKGKNLATKEDIGDITRKVEEVKTGYLSDIERLKVDLSLLSRKKIFSLMRKYGFLKSYKNGWSILKNTVRQPLGRMMIEGSFILI